jgi:hypothetical protein
MKRERRGQKSFQRGWLLLPLCIAQTARGETSLNTISLPGPLALKILWIVAAVGLIYLLGKQRRAKNRL